MLANANFVMQTWSCTVHPLNWGLREGVYIIYHNFSFKIIHFFTGVENAVYCSILHGCVIIMLGGQHGQSDTDRAC